MAASTRNPVRGALALILLLLLIGFAASASAASAVTLTVDTLSDGSGGGCSPIDPCTLREAIELAAKGEEASAEINGEVNIAFDIEGEIKVVGEYEIRAGEGVDAVKIDGFGGVSLNGNEHGRVFSADGDVTISGLDVVNGRVTGAAVDGDGGAALLVKGGDVTLEDVHFFGNQIESLRAGGAIDVEDGDLTIVDSAIFENTSGDAGGGINFDSSGTLTLRNTRVTSNVAEGVGGGVYQDEGDLVVSESTISLNEAVGSHGGGIAAEPDGSHTTTITETTVLGNRASGSYGGGIVADAGSGGLTIEDSTISDNTGTYGGGIAANGPTTIERITLAKNVGGGIWADSADVEISAATIADNESPNKAGGGIASGEEVVLRSSIVAGNTGPGGVADDCAAEVISEGHNILGVTGGECDWPSGEGDQLGVDPELGGLTENGGPTKTMAPISAPSPAINQGGDPAATDQRGQTRPVPEGVQFTDVGAVEVQAPVNETAPSVSPTTDLVEGDELSCEAGSWDNDTIIDATYSYAWLVDGDPVESGPTYALAADDVGKEVVCRVGADNGAAITQASSAGVVLQPGALALDPASFDFGGRNLGGGPSAPKAFTLKNSGGGAVEVDAVGSSDATQFPVDGSDCTTGPLAPGDECTIQARFAPTALGAQSATLSVVSEAPTATAQLDGTGTVPTVAIAPSSFDFGSRRIDSGPSTAKVFEVSSAGTGPVTIGASATAGTDSTQFSIPADGDECSGQTLQPAETCTVEVVFDPTTGGAAVATLAVPSDAPTATAGLSGTGTVGALAISPTTFDFGPRAISSGPGAPQIFEVTSAGTAAVEVDTASVSAEFEIPTSGNDCADETLEPAETCTVEVVFDPDTLGTRNGSLGVSSDVPTATAALTGNGLADPVFSAAPSELGFGSHQVGTTTVQTVTISNAGGAPANVDSVAILGTDAPFALTAGGDACSGAELAPAETCTIEVAFTPSVAGFAIATLKVEGGAPATLVPLTGSGVASPAPPKPALSSVSLLNGGVPIANAGGAVPLTIGCNSPGGAPCVVAVALQAGGTALGSWSGTLAPSTSQTVDLPLSAAGRKQLGAKGELAAEAVLSVAGGNGATVPLTLLAPKAPALKLKSAKQIGDSVLFKLFCGGYVPRCKGKLTLTDGSTKLVAGKVSLAKGGGEKVLPLTAAGKRLLEAEARPQLLATLSVKDATYQRTTTVKKKLRLAGS